MQEMGAARLGQALDIENAFVIVLVGLITLTVGTVLFALATLRAKVLPRMAVMPLIIGLLLFALASSGDRRAFLAVPFGLAWVWLGYTLWRVIERQAV